uniref:hypothetical protein n=1 Tax=Staphylococcus shinii TaxID=2912228 RepID=UPI003F563D39
MDKIKKGLYTFLAFVALTLPLAGCGNEEEEADKGKEEQGVHKPKDEVFSTDEKKDMQEQADQ